MKLQPFTGDTLQQWRETGYNFVKLTPSDEMSVNNLPGEPFTLLEPYLNDDEALESDNVVALGAPEIEQVIREGSGRYYG